MSTYTAPPPINSWAARMGPASARFTDDEFYEFCRLNPHLRVERMSHGEVIIMPPVGGMGGNREFNLSGVFYQWATANGRGIPFSPSTGFRLPNGAIRSADVAWVERSRWEALTDEEREKFPPLCPDFVAEVRSATDDLGDLQAKMEEYLANGIRLGWLIDPRQRKVYIYRPDAEVVCLDDPATISGDPVLPGFTLELAKVWGG